MVVLKVLTQRILGGKIAYVLKHGKEWEEIVMICGDQVCDGVIKYLSDRCRRVGSEREKKFECGWRDTVVFDRQFPYKAEFFIMYRDGKVGGEDVDHLIDALLWWEGIRRRLRYDLFINNVLLSIGVDGGGLLVYAASKYRDDIVIVSDCGCTAASVRSITDLIRIGRSLSGGQRLFDQDAVVAVCSLLSGLNVAVLPGIVRGELLKFKLVFC